MARSHYERHRKLAPHELPTIAADEPQRPAHDVDACEQLLTLLYKHHADKAPNAPKDPPEH